MLNTDSPKVMAKREDVKASFVEDILYFNDLKERINKLQNLLQLSKKTKKTDGKNGNLS